MRTVRISTIIVPSLSTHTRDLDKGALFRKYSSVPFKIQELAPNKSAWDSILNGTYIASTHHYERGERKSENWNGCETLFLDFDSKEHPVTTDEIIERLNKLNDGHGVNYYINHSNGHSPEQGVVKFHLYLPFNSGVTDPEEYARIWEWALHRFPEMDRSCGDLARFSLRGNPNYPSYFESGKHDLDIEQVLSDWVEIELTQSNQKLRETAEFISTHQLNDVGILSMETRVKFEDGSISTLGELDPETKPQFLCPFCGEDDDRGNKGKHNATYQLSNATGTPIIYCSSCDAAGRGAGGKGVYNLLVDDLYQWIERQHRFKVFRDVTNNHFVDRRFSRSKGSWVMSIINREGINNRYALHELKAPASFPEYEVRLGFDQDEWLDEAMGVVYKYQPTEYLLEPLPAVDAKMPVLAEKLMKHVTGDDDACYEYFLDWLAAIVQLRKKLLTSWVLHGVQGTGKGILYHSILKPLFGQAFTAALNQDALESRFNSVFQDCVFIVFDEVQVDFSKNSGNSVNARIKLLITEQMMNFEPKGIDAKQGENECNFLFFSNQGNAVKIEENDRRFNVAPRQEVKLENAAWLPVGGIDQLKRDLAATLNQLAVHLRQREYNPDVIHLPLDTEAKQSMIAATRTSGEDFFLKMIKPLDWDLMEESLEQTNFGDFRSRRNASTVVALRKQSAKDAVERSYLTNSDIADLYNNIVNTSKQDVKKTAIAKKASVAGLTFKVFKDKHGKSQRGWKI